ncbi:MAG: hypothetical protein O9262_09245 [Cyclobacteriaceae bacterium]|nr:hypothetical protein [Cyclobacteriaceae bacterium]
MKTKRTTTHLGRKIGRIHEMLCIKQDTLLGKLGVTMQAVSKIEQQT